MNPMLLILGCACLLEAVPRAAQGAAPPARPDSVISFHPHGSCAHAQKDSLTSDCLLIDPDQRAKVGTFCALHPRQRLMLDTVRVSYGFSCSPDAGEIPGVCINSRLMACGGCVQMWPYAEVAYCPECRRARKQWENEIQY